MSDTCTFCGAELLPPNTYCPTAKYACGSFPDGFRSKTCYEAEIAKLTAELKQLRDEDDTPPIDERLADAGKLFRELVAEREELRREVTRLRAACEESNRLLAIFSDPKLERDCWVNHPRIDLPKILTSPQQEAT